VLAPPSTYLLVVEDDDAISLVLRDLLHAVGYQVITVPDGLLEQVRASPYRQEVLRRAGADTRLRSLRQNSQDVFPRKSYWEGIVSSSRARRWRTRARATA